MSQPILKELGRILSPGSIIQQDAWEPYTHDTTILQGLKGQPDAVIAPQSMQELQNAINWCYLHDVAIIPRGGGTGLAGGCVPIGGGVVISLENLSHALNIDVKDWQAYVDAGITTQKIQKAALENGLYFPPDPGASEQSQIGGNIATNAGGPHCLKYGTVSKWVKSLEVITAYGERHKFGTDLRKDACPIDLKSLFIGSEGVLGIIARATLSLIPKPEHEINLLATCKDSATAVKAMESIFFSGIVPSFIEFIDEYASALAPAPSVIPSTTSAAFVLLMGIDGEKDYTVQNAKYLVEILRDVCDEVKVLSSDETKAMWKWRSSMTFGVSAKKGGKVSDDFSVPYYRIPDLIEHGKEIGIKHNLEFCSWGHAADGTVHATYLVDPKNPQDVQEATAALNELMTVAVSFGGSISAEHGVGFIKKDYVSLQLGDKIIRLQNEIKKVFDPKGLFNPGKKFPVHV